MRKIYYITKVLSIIKMDIFILKLRQYFVKDIPILTYHRICEYEQYENYPFDIDLISATKKDFYWQMQFIKKHFNPVKLATLCDFIDGKVNLPKNPIIVTFDDGFEDNYDVAFPILKKLGVPATLFVTTSFVDEKYTIWYERLAHFLLGCDLDVEIPELDIRFSGTVDKCQRRSYYSEIVEKLKVVSNAKRLKILSDLYKKYGEDYLSSGEDVIKLSRSVSWDQLKEMSESIFDIGSHTITHPVLTMLTDKDLISELVGSKKILESNLGIKIDTLAYPVGMSFAYDQRVKVATKNAGYRLGLSYIEGENHLQKLDEFALRRIHVDRYAPNSMFTCKLAAPIIFND